MPRQITPNLWFDGQAEEAAAFYCSVFDDSRIVSTARYPENSPGPAGTVMTVEFELDGQKFTALNGGPVFTFNEAISLEVYCETQDEIDYYWERLSAGGDPKAQQCGWLKDRYGVSWQVAPTDLTDMLADETSPKSQRAFEALLQMKKLDIAALKRAYDG